ncbi:hypothetical protein AB1Y20_016599 [Prymnesium parvum]|uniref:Methyltransferase FkbM domain-containing protein n=1 Tax=Prymnesium parvum TaxID=97485 RepID=A0AB34IA99_PRYPA
MQKMAMVSSCHRCAAARSTAELLPPPVYQWAADHLPLDDRLLSLLRTSLLVRANLTINDRVLPLSLHVPTHDATKLRNEFHRGLPVWLDRTLPLLPPHTITALDVGANIGAVSMLLFASRPCARVVALEPSAHTALFLRWNLHDHAVPLLSSGAPCGVALRLGALAPVARRVAVHYDPQHSSMLARTTENAAPNATGFASHVDATTIGHLVDEYGDVALLKLDCEGCETEVLRALAAAPNVSARIGFAAGELHGCGKFATSYKRKAAHVPSSPECLENVVRLRRLFRNRTMFERAK